MSQFESRFKDKNGTDKLTATHRFPPDVISYAVWLYHRFNLSNRDVEDLLVNSSSGTVVTAIRKQQGRAVA